MRSRLRGVIVGAAATVCLSMPTTGAAQYFGQNRVRYEQFDVRLLATQHFDIHHPASAEPVARDMARMAERWVTRLTPAFGGHRLRARHPIILYANHPDFQQSNLASAELDEGTRGFAESIRGRIVMPMSGVAAENDHVLGHEIAHLYQFDLAATLASSSGGLFTLPLWFVEGMAEYLTLGRDDPNTAMWVRAGLAVGRLPSVEQLTTDRSFFPYRFGHALWAYVAGVYGDDVVPRLFASAVRRGLNGAIAEVLQTSSEELTRAWHTQIALDYVDAAQGRDYPEAVGIPITGVERLGGLLLSPALSPDGTRLAGFARHGMFGLDLVLLDVASGRVLRTLAGPSNDPHGDAVSFLQASGAWSPDGTQFAYVVLREGDHEVAFVNVASGASRGRLRLDGVQSINAVAWAPDGRRMAIAGTSNGQPDIFLHDLLSNVTTRVTNDATAELHPAWSPDGRLLAIATDRVEPGLRDLLLSTPSQLALLDPVSGRQRALPGFPGARMSTPQFSADGRSLLFVGDRGGVADLFRLELGTGTFSQLTRLVSGISGITERSPALTVAAVAGTVVFTTFDGTDYLPIRFDPARLGGEPLRIAADGDGLGTLSPIASDPDDLVQSYLADPAEGLPSLNAGAFRTAPYRPRFGIEGVGQPQVGVASGPLGTAVGGGTSIFFGDLLGRQRIGVAVQAQGTLRDLGGQLFYQNTATRWTWFTSVGRTPFVTAQSASGVGTVPIGGVPTRATILENSVQRTFFDQAAIGAQYPFSRTLRLELTMQGTRQSSEIEVTQQVVAGGRVVSNARDRFAGDLLTYGQAGMALVGDASVFGFTSPIRGHRWRLEIGQTTGDFDFGTALADVRRYFWVRPITLAVRGYHFGRYGRDAERLGLAPLLLGQSALVRGYRPETFTFAECAASGGAGGRCPALDRLVGSRLGVASVELRIPLTGARGMRLLNVGFLPIDVAPFVDGGVAWTGAQSPVWQSRADNTRIPVFSAGVATRVNLGFAIVEAYWARPFQRAGRDGQFGINLAPGW
jgi:hypothetical protein